MLANIKLLLIQFRSFTLNGKLIKRVIEMFVIPELKYLVSESDVEQKVIYPWLTSNKPHGLGILPSAVITKANIKRFKIDKGKSSKIYFPDYLIVISGFPLVVIEAKAPTEDLEEAYREARLYSSELNACFTTNINPVKYIIACNGESLVAGYSDHEEPEYNLKLEELTPYNEKMSKLQSEISINKLEEIALKFSQELHPQYFKKPRKLIGGPALQNEEIGQNSFGMTITADFGSIFNPTTTEERAFIVKNGYIASRRRERYVDPIDRVIRAAKPPSVTESIEIEDTSKPKEIIDKFKNAKPLEQKILLLIGSVGSGKSTFIDYLQEVSIPREVIATTVWCRLNMNTAPVSPNEIYNWLRKGIIKGCKEAYKEIDFDNLDVIKSLYSVEINKFNKGVGQLYRETDQKTYNLKLAEIIQEAQFDLQKSTLAHIRFCCGERNKLLIIVLDNCDKRLRDEQLLMFEAAHWLQSQFRALVILPLREETYDNHRDQPPLDTALKDLVFRIEPPMFQPVLVKRVQLALNEMMKMGGGKLHYDLPNGFKVEYPASEQGFYLSSILKSIFEHDRYVRRMIVGLSGRNMRRALEIFLEFCNSGYIAEDQIFKIRQSEGKHVLPLYLVARVLLRLNRRFYDSDHSYIKNVFGCNQQDPIPNHFTRLMILRWLFNKFGSPGTNGLKGYYPKKVIKNELSPFGISSDILDREIEYLLKADCIIAEDLRTESISEEDLIKIAPAGFVHIDSLGSVEYLAAVAEDTWFSEEKIAEKIAGRISRTESHFHIQNTVDNARDLIGYLSEILKKSFPSPNSFLEENNYKELIDLSLAQESIERVQLTQQNNSWFDAEKKYPKGSEHAGIIVNIKHYGIFVELEAGVSGLIHKDNLPSNFLESDGFETGEKIRIQILFINSVDHKLSMKFIRFEEHIPNQFSLLP